MIDRESIVVTAASGVTGAGRRAAEEYSLAELDGDYRAYRVLRHQHAPEVEQTIGAPICFTPHLLPLRRGILCTTTARLAPGVDGKAVTRRLEQAFAGEPFVELLPSAEAVSLRRVVGTNRIAIGHACDGTMLVLVSAIDNLTKGAAGQAVQNLNLLLGLPEVAGLQQLRPHHP